jgi:hypothetical protein
LPEKLERCVSDVKAQGKSDDSAWGICVDSTGEKPHKESHDNDFANSIKAEVVEAIILKERAGDNKFLVKNKGKEKGPNKNRQVPVSNPPIKKGKIEPDIQKTPKDVGGKRLNQDSILWKNIFDSQLKRNVKEPKI